MQFNNPNLAIGGLLGGVLQGLEQRRQQQTEMEHKKALLKLEKDKIKLLEKEVELRGQSEQGKSLLDALRMQSEAQKPTVVGKSLVTPGGRAIFTEPSTPPKLSEQFITQPYGVIGPTEGGGLGVVPGTAPPPEFLKTQGAEATPDKIQIAERLSKETGIPIGQALEKVMGMDEASMRMELTKMLASLLILTGRDVEFDKLEKAIDRIIGKSADEGIQSRFSKDPQMKGFSLGKQTPQGWEVLDKAGKLLGHYE